ncbi:hypothetical protein L2E82_06443 [Cichorium intybus]|uniref:Uncharacterized protein n=1 Tax=Cichorium intybus TaxID=13427 RepID=A0ACB9HBK0_CICIN|nr:hypothetical protein L2E82_06443 [Cichorium intybus]
MYRYLKQRLNQDNNDDFGGQLVTMRVKLDKKHATIAMRACYRSASRHPIVVVMILFTIWLRRSFPLLFSLLVYASPVIVSTVILLGALLLFGHQQDPKHRKVGKPHNHEIQNLRVWVTEDTETGEKSEPREISFGKKFSVVNNVNVDNNNKLVTDKNVHGSGVSMADKKLKEDEKNVVANHNQKTDLGKDKTVFVKSCGQLANNIVDHKQWETESELAESSTTISMAGNFPIVDDLPPFLQPELPHHAHMLHVHKSGPDVPHNAHIHKRGPEVSHHAQMSQATSERSLESDDDRDHEDEEDDQKNPKNLGKSEVERNEHMENIIARQKAIRNMRMQAEENLANINLDISYSATPCASTRRNSFDVPIDFNETVLESAPIVTMPIIDNFNILHNPSGDKSYPVVPIFQPDSLSFQPNQQFNHHHAGPTIITASRQNESYYTSGASENVSQRSPSSSSDDDDDTNKLHHVARNERLYQDKTSNAGERGREKSRVGTSHGVKTSHGDEKGYQGKSSSESSSSSSFSDVSDHLDDEEEEYEYRSAIMPSTPEQQAYLELCL